MADDLSNAGSEWQIRVWDKMADIYQQEIDSRFGPVVEQVLVRADLQPGQTALDLGTGTGSVAFAAAAQVGTDGSITAVDISPEMLAMARTGAAERSLANIDFEEGRAEAIPARDQSQDAVLASLSLMYVIDRASAAKEIARVLRPGGRLVAAVWAGADTCDIVQFQQIAGSFAATPPVEGVGPGALADLVPFLDQLSQAGLETQVEVETTGFRFADFESAWNALAGVTTAALEPEVLNQAKSAVRQRMWRDSDAPRHFRNGTQFIVARKRS